MAGFPVMCSDHTYNIFTLTPTNYDDAFARLLERLQRSGHTLWAPLTLPPE